MGANPDFAVEEVAGNGYTGRESPTASQSPAGEMADAGARAKCYGCRQTFSGDVDTVEEVFGYMKPGDAYTRCRPCRAKHNEASKAFCARNKETYRAYAKAYKEAHSEELSAKARERIACERCGRMVCRDKMTHHQSTRLCEKRRPAP